MLGGTLVLGKTAGVNAIPGNLTIGDLSGSDILLITNSEQIANTAIVSLKSGGSGNSAFLRINGGVTETVGKAFFDNVLSASLTLGYTSFTVQTTSGQVVGRANASYSMGKWGTVSLTLSSNRFNYSDPTAGNSYGEYQGSLSYNIHF